MNRETFKALSKEMREPLLEVSRCVKSEARHYIDIVVAPNGGTEVVVQDASEHTLSIDADGSYTLSDKGGIFESGKIIKKERPHEPASSGAQINNQDNYNMMIAEYQSEKLIRIETILKYMDGYTALDAIKDVMGLKDDGSN